MINTNFIGSEIIQDRYNKIIRTLTPGQEKLLETMKCNDIVFVNGPAGTGKTSLAIWYGIAGIDSGIYDHLVLTRPILEAGEELGFLPGTFEEKVAPYMQPLYDAIERVKGKKIDSISPVIKEKVIKSKTRKSRRKNKNPDNSIENSDELIMQSNEDFYKKVNICPLAYLRGTTKSHSFIVFDEAQNSTKKQMELMLTRLGKGSKLIICGDDSQTDLEDIYMSGFIEARKLLSGVHHIGFINFTLDDIVRHKLIKEIIIRYANKNKPYKHNSSFGPININDYDCSSDDEELSDISDPHKCLNS